MEAIVAVYSDWGIGARGTQPIVIPEDRRRFAQLTKGATVIVGRRTEATRDCGRVFVIGGATVYMAMFQYLDRIHVTKIGAQPKSDAYFPNLDSLPDWKCTAEEPFTSGGYQCSFCTYERVE